MIVSDEMQKLRKEESAAYFKVLLNYLFGWTEEYYRNPQSG
jgi:hypothetical protein